MKVHQVMWEKENPNLLSFNELSCFECSIPCQHYHVNDVEYDAEDSISAFDSVDDVSTSNFFFFVLPLQNQSLYNPCNFFFLFSL